jgi:hypothetical protein
MLISLYHSIQSRLFTWPSTAAIPPSLLPRLVIRSIARERRSTACARGEEMYDFYRDTPLATPIQNIKLAGSTPRFRRRELHTPQ